MASNAPTSEPSTDAPNLSPPPPFPSPNCQAPHTDDINDAFNVYLHNLHQTNVDYSVTLTTLRKLLQQKTQQYELWQVKCLEFVRARCGSKEEVEQQMKAAYRMGLIDGWREVVTNGREMVRELEVFLERAKGMLDQIEEAEGAEGVI
jgi:hypothetical protein